MINHLGKLKILLVENSDNKKTLDNRGFFKAKVPKLDEMRRAGGNKCLSRRSPTAKTFISEAQTARQFWNFCGAVNGN